MRGLPQHDAFFAYLTDAIRGEKFNARSNTERVAELEGLQEMLLVRCGAPSAREPGLRTSTHRRSRAVRSRASRSWMRTRSDCLRPPTACASCSTRLTSVPWRVPAAACLRARSSRLTRAQILTMAGDNEFDADFFNLLDQARALLRRLRVRAGRRSQPALQNILGAQDAGQAEASAFMVKLRDACQKWRVPA